MLSGITVLSYWTWFIVPGFHLPPIPPALAIGLGLMISYMTKTGVMAGPTKEDMSQREFMHTLWSNFGNGIGKAAAFLFLGWVVKHWMP